MDEWLKDGICGIEGESNSSETEATGTTGNS